MDTRLGQVVILNGAPRSGKSSIAAAIQRTFDGPWINLGVDASIHATPERYRPGIGLRPGGERPDLEPFVVAAYAAVYEAIAAHSRHGLSVVVDAGHHDSYSRPLGILSSCARGLEGLPVLFVGVRCPIEVILARRSNSEGYTIGHLDSTVPDPIRRWQDEVHRHGVYDLEVDTSLLTPDRCAEVIGRRLSEGPPGAAFHGLAHPD